jgi:hypothetical protein
MTFSRGALDTRCEELVELKKYDRCANKISDHKPVRALLNVKVKSVDWEEYERDLLLQYEAACREHQYSSKSSYMFNRGVLPLTASARSILLQSCLPERRKVTLTLRNNLPSETIQFFLNGASIPKWLHKSQDSGLVAAGESLRRTAR